jgi:hypothetical protein
MSTAKMCLLGTAVHLGWTADSGPSRDTLKYVEDNVRLFLEIVDLPHLWCSVRSGYSRSMAAAGGTLRLQRYLHRGSVIAVLPNQSTTRCGPRH